MGSLGISLLEEAHLRWRCAGIGRRQPMQVMEDGVDRASASNQGQHTARAAAAAACQDVYCEGPFE